MCAMRKREATETITLLKPGTVTLYQTTILGIECVIVQCILSRYIHLHR